MQLFLAARQIFRRILPDKEFLNGLMFKFITATASLWALLSDDIRLCFLPNCVDGYFALITIIVVIIFILDIILNLMHRDFYLSICQNKSNLSNQNKLHLKTSKRRVNLFSNNFSFYFCMDLLATLSVLLQVIYF